MRNGALAVVAGFVVWEGYHDAGASAVSWLSTPSVAQLVALISGDDPDENRAKSSEHSL